MANPIVIAHHLIWTGYGWWLPNDPRGSGSRAIASDVIAALGELHHGRKSIQPPRQVLSRFLDESAGRLKFDRLSFDHRQRTDVGAALGHAVAERGYTCYACAVMPDHVHLVIRKHRNTAEQMIEHLQLASRLRLSSDWPVDDNHPVWTRGGWKVFLDHPDDIRRTIRYVDRNPLGLNLPAQRWPFVTPYDGWPLHPGHSPNSPYAKRLRAVGRYP